MISYLPFKAEHITAMRVQEAQCWVGMTEESWPVFKTLEDHWSNTIMKDGVPILCGGVIEYWTNRGGLWAIVSKECGPSDFVTVHRLVEAFINALPYPRLEFHVDVDFDNGHRWAKLLGFSCEAPRMRAYQPNGRDAALYARVKHG
jgi:hypothetical protein